MPQAKACATVLPKVEAPRFMPWGRTAKPQAVTVTAVNLTLGLIDISGPASLLRAGVALYDAGQGEAFETDVALNLRDTVRPALRLEREVDAEGAQNGARRFAYIEAAPLEGSARARVFDVLATATSIGRWNCMTALATPS